MFQFRHWLIQILHITGESRVLKNETVPDAGKLYTDLLQKNGGFYLGDTKKKDIYLTFDNGYENGYTGKILDVLKEKKVPATFFVTGHYIKTQKRFIVKNEG